jgi:hypothetical protein
MNERTNERTKEPGSERTRERFEREREREREILGVGSETASPKIKVRKESDAKLETVKSLVKRELDV